MKVEQLKWKGTENPVARTLLHVPLGFKDPNRRVPKVELALSRQTIRSMWDGRARNVTMNPRRLRPALCIMQHATCVSMHIR